MYIEKYDGYEEDGLISVAFPTSINNVKVAANASLSRGDLLCGESMSGIFGPVASNDDAAKILMIAAEDFVADSLNAVTSAYSAGEFNREKISCAGGSITDFEAEMRKQNLHLTSLKG